jgi:hypothetical protein
MLTALLFASLGQLNPTVKAQQDGVLLGTYGWWATLNCVSPVTCTRYPATGVLDITSSGGGGGAPTTAEYVTYAANASLSAERVLSAGNYTVIDLGTAAQAQVDWSHGLTCSAGQVLTSASTTTMACTSTITASDVACAGTCIADAEIAAVAASKVTGVLAQANGGTGAGALTCAAGERLTSNGTIYSCSAVVTQAYTTAEDEATPLTQRNTLNFTGAGVSCADTGGKTVCTISGGGGGGASPLSVVLGTP